jgi:hypothetical protein
MYTGTMQKIATGIFILASLVFGVLGILVVFLQPKDNSALSRSLMATVIVILVSFALSVAGKYLKDKS